MTAFESGLTPARNVALFHLEVNPDGIKQIEGNLKGASDEMCAAGVACHALAIDMSSPSAAEGALAKMLGVPLLHVKSIFTLNDNRKLTLPQCGAVLRLYFDQSGTYESIQSPDQVYQANKSAIMLVK